MNQHIDKIKNHLRENKKVYICTAVGVAVGAVGVMLVSNRSNSGAQIVQKINQIGFRNEANPTIIELIERSTPSKPIHLVGTERYFNSIHDAARKTGHTINQISKNANGLVPNVDGDVFEFLTPAA